VRCAPATSEGETQPPALVREAVETGSTRSLCECDARGLAHQEYDPEEEAGVCAVSLLLARALDPYDASNGAAHRIIRGGRSSSSVVGS
jgi:hypothetical protein